MNCKGLAGRRLVLILCVLLSAGCGRTTAVPTRVLAPTFTATVAPLDAPLPLETQPAETPVAGRAAAASPSPTTVTATDANVVTLPERTNPSETPIPVASDILPTPTPVALTDALPAPSVVTAMADAQRSLRWGEITAARAILTNLLRSTALGEGQMLEVRLLLARVELTDQQPTQALAVLDSLPAVAALDPLMLDLQAKTQMLRGEALYSLGRYSDAIAAYWLFLERFPHMGEAIQPRIAAAYLALGDNASAATAYRRAADAVAAQTDDPVALVQLLENLAIAQDGAGLPAAAVSTYDEILSVAKNAPYRAEIQYKAGLLLADAGDGPGALVRWRAATDEAPESEAAYAALVELVNREAAFDLFQRGAIDLAAGAWEPAINAYQAYLATVDPSDTRYGDTLLGLGQALLGAENPAAAVPYLQRLIADFSACDCFGEAWLTLARAQLLLGDSVTARRTYRTFAREHGDHPLAAEALWRSGLAALAEENDVEAGLDLLTLADAFPTSERTPSALYVVGVGALQKGFANQAVLMLARLQTDYPDYRWDAVGYWLGRAHAAQGDAADAEAQWAALVERAPDIYFGLLAAQARQGLALENGAMVQNLFVMVGPATRLDGDDASQSFAEAWLTTWLDAGELPLTTLPEAIVADSDLVAGRLLVELGVRAEALTRLQRVYERNKDDPRALYALGMEFERLGFYRLSLLSFARLLQSSPGRLVEDAPIFLQQRVYPRPFSELIVREAQANGIEPALFFSLIRQESLFEDSARSSASARGLAQIIPDTGEWVAAQLGVTNFSNDQLDMPVLNLKFGAFYLAWVRDYVDGNWVSALAGYNAGPGNVARWRERSGADDTVFVEILDFAEPRIYIQAILSNYYHYLRLYGTQ